MDKNIIFDTFLEQGITYETYLQLTDDLLAQGKTTGPVQSEELTEYTRLNQVRMLRINKTVQPKPELTDMLNNLERPLLWGVITEAWCGDAAQSVPVLAALAAATPMVEFRILLRDENPEIMDCYLTNGGRSIPKLVCFDATTKAEIFNWGPRPAEAQNLILSLKSNPDVPMQEIIEQIQLWYARDRTASTQSEIRQLLEITL